MYGMMSHIDIRQRYTEGKEEENSGTFLPRKIPDWKLFDLFIQCTVRPSSVNAMSAVTFASGLMEFNVVKSSCASGNTASIWWLSTVSVGMVSKKFFYDTLSCFMNPILDYYS